MVKHTLPGRFVLSSNVFVSHQASVEKTTHTLPLETKRTVNIDAIHLCQSQFQTGAVL